MDLTPSERYGLRRNKKARWLALGTVMAGGVLLAVGVKRRNRSGWAMAAVGAALAGWGAAEYWRGHRRQARNWNQAMAMDQGSTHANAYAEAEVLERRQGEFDLGTNIDAVDEASEASFPASDPPSGQGSTGA